MDPDLFKNMSAWDKLKTLTSGAWAGSKLLKNNFSGYLEHSEYPEHLNILFKEYNPELGTKRVDRGPLDRALNYGGGYQFGETSGLSLEDTDSLAKAYQLRGYLVDKYLKGASPQRLQDASMDYYENMAGARQAYEDKAAGKKYQNIRELSAEYAKDSLSKEEKDFQEGIRKTGWFKEFKKQYGEEPDLNTKDYDYRKAWAAGIRPVRDPYDNNRYHWSSSLDDGTMLKSKDHPTAWKEYYMRMTGKNPDEVGATKQDYESMIKRSKK